jgi:heat shock protein HslJ
MNRLFLSFLALVIITGFFYSCSPRLAADKYWSGKRYTLVEMKEVPVQQSGTRRDAYIEFLESEKRFSGNGGCNQISGNYTLDKREIKFTDVISTKMSCPDIEFETVFLQLLSEVDRYEMENDHIVMKDGRRKLLRFRVR